MKKYYIGVQVKNNEKFYAFLVTVNASDNLLSKLSIKNIIAANIFNSRKEATEICWKWNEGFKEYGRYLFDN